MSINKKVKLNHTLETKVSERKKMFTSNSVDISKVHAADQKPKKPIDEKLLKKNVNGGKTISKTISRSVFHRQFSKYDGVQHKLKSKFKSPYQGSGKINQNSTNYKAFFDQNQKGEKKLFFKNSMCSFRFKENNSRKKNAALCPNLPGEGTYNHRLAYDEALKLHQKGVDVGVLYKVKTKTNSTYLINGEFLLMSNNRLVKPLRKTKGQTNAKTKPQKKIEENDELVKRQNKSGKEEEALLLVAEMQKLNNERKQKLSRIASVQRAKAEKEKIMKLEDFLRKQTLRGTEKKLRSEQLTKELRENALKKKNKRKEEEMQRKRLSAQRAKEEREKIKMDLANKKMEKLKQSKLQRTLQFKYKIDNNTNCTINNKQEILPNNSNYGLEV